MHYHKCRVCKWNELRPTEEKIWSDSDKDEFSVGSWVAQASLPQLLLDVILYAQVKLSIRNIVKLWEIVALALRPHNKRRQKQESPRQILPTTICAQVINDLRLKMKLTSTSCPSFWVRVVLGTSCPGYGCTVYKLSWEWTVLVRIVLNTSCPGYEQSWIRVRLGTKFPGYESPWVRIVLRTPATALGVSDR